MEIGQKICLTSSQCQNNEEAPASSTPVLSIVPPSKLIALVGSMKLSATVATSAIATYDSVKAAAIATSAETKGELLDKTHKMPSIPLVVDYEGGDHFCVRDCYAEYYQIIEQLLDRNKRCVTVTGTPGIGKSIFYAYFYDCFRKEHDKTWIVAAAFDECKFRRATLFKDGVETILYAYGQYEAMVETAEKTGRKLLYLCDGAPEVTQHQMVVFTSPNEGWEKVSRKHVCAYYMPLWTLEELQEAAAVLNLPIEDTIIAERYNKFGGVARECLCLDTCNLEVVEHQIVDVINKFTSPEEVRNILLEIENVEMCHRLLHSQPRPENRQLKITRFASRFMEQKVMNKMLRLLQGKRENFKSFLGGIAEAATLRRWMFEVEAHETLRHGGDFALRLLDRSKKTSTVESIHLDESENIDEFDLYNLSPSVITRGPYHKPNVKTLQSLDSFYLRGIFLQKVDEGKLKKRDKLTTRLSFTKTGENLSKNLLLFQITVSENHAVNAWGVIDILSKLRYLDKLDQVALVFIVPDELLHSFKPQSIIPVDVPTPVRDIDSIIGIGRRTQETLTRYGVTSVAQLVESVERYNRGEIPLLDSKDRRAWENAVLEHA